MDEKLVRDVRLLKAYALVTTLALVVVFLRGFRSELTQTFGVIDAQRINIVEPDGKLDMVITDKVHFPPPIWKGKAVNVRRSGETEHGVPGIIFYNGEETEDGGLFFSGATQDGKTEAGAGLIFDQYNNEDLISMGYDDHNGARTAALQVWERPNTPLIDLMKELEAIQHMPSGPAKNAAMKALRPQFGGQTRVFIGKNPEDTSEVILSDAQGRPRIRITVDRSGESHLEFLDAEGKVVYDLPPKRAR